MRENKIGIIVGVIVAVFLIVGGALALRQHAETSVTSTSEGSDADHEHGDPLSPEHAQPETVATNAMSMIFSWQPGRDRSGWEALNRAAQTDLLTGVLAKAAATEPNPLPRPVSDWAAWERSGDTVTAAGAAQGAPVVDGDSATVEVQVRQIVIHPDGASTPYKTSRATVTLEQDSSGIWRAANYRIGETQ